MLDQGGSTFSGESRVPKSAYSRHSRAYTGFVVRDGNATDLRRWSLFFFARLRYHKASRYVNTRPAKANRELGDVTRFLPYSTIFVASTYILKTFIFMYVRIELGVFFRAAVLPSKYTSPVSGCSPAEVGPAQP